MPTSLASFRILWARIGARARRQGLTRLEVLETLITEGLDTWDRLEVGKRRPRKTSMRPAKPAFIKYADPGVPESIQ